MDACRVFLPEDPAGSQGQTGNNGLYAFLLLFWEGGGVRGEDMRGELHCPQMDEAGSLVLQFKYDTDTDDYI